MQKLCFYFMFNMKIWNGNESYTFYDTEFQKFCCNVLTLKEFLK